MELIKRHLQQTITEKLFKGKVIMLIGARQVGKSTLFAQLLSSHDNNEVMSLNCDEPEVVAMLENMNTSELRMLVGDKRIVMIDEAQRVPNIGMTLKRMADNLNDVQILVTGSSSFQLRNSLEETLTGRKFEYNLYPISTSELMSTYGLLKVKQTLEARLIYGSYPDILNNSSNAKELLMNISGSYLYKDILTAEGIRKPALLDKLLVALALQIGSEVSYNELAQTIGSDSKTVEKYIDLLEKYYVVFRLSAFIRNLRTELKKGRKIYFYDNGIRNAVLQNFAPISLRNDIGALWENFFISERIKHNHYNGRYVRSYFWRTTQQQEIDYIEEEDGRFSAFEMKWNVKRSSAQIPQKFASSYDVKEFAVITPENYIDWV